MKIPTKNEQFATHPAPLLVGLALLLITFFGVGHAEELSNGDFSIGTPDGATWDVAGWTRHLVTGSSLNLDLKDASTDPIIGAGNQALRISDGNTEAYQEFAATDYQSLTFSADAMVDRVGNVWEPQLQVAWHDHADALIGSEEIVVSLDPDTAAEDVWHSLSGASFAPVGAVKARVTVRVVNSGNGGAQGLVYFDNVSAMTNPTPTLDTDLEVGLLGYWRFDNDLFDSTGRGFHGTASGGVSFAAGVAGQAVSLDAASDQIGLGLGDLPRPWTVSLWVNKQSTGNDIETLFDSTANSVRLDQAGSAEAGVSAYGVADGTLDKAVPNGQWVHVALVANDETMSIFVDGFAYGAFENAFPFQSIDLPLDVIGAADGQNGLIADLDELGVWSRELNAAEIRHLYLGGQSGDTIEQISTALDGQSLGLPGPGVTQQAYATIGEEIHNFDITTEGLGGEEGRTTSGGYRNGWFYLDSRKVAGSGGMSVWDFSDLTNPRRVSQYQNMGRPLHLQHETIDSEQGLHYLQNYANEDNPRSWDMTQFPAMPQQTVPGQTFRRSPTLDAYMVPPYAYYGQRGYRRSVEPFQIWDMRTDTLLAELDFQNEMGFRGTGMVIGNMLVVTANRSGDGIATYDISNPRNPVLMDLLYGVGSAYELAFYNGKIIMPGKDVAGRNSIGIVDASDPYNLVAETRLDIPAQYVHFQDNYMFAANRKIDMDDYSNLYTIRGGIGQYHIPIGNAVFILGAKGVALFVTHDLNPDTTGPSATFHLPADGAVDQLTTSRVGIFIPEAIDSISINDTTVILRVLEGADVPATLTYCDKGILNITPKSELATRTTYEVVLPQGGITDVIGNGLENELRFTFTTADVAVDPNNLVPSVDDIALSLPSPLPLNQDFTVTASASDPEAGAVEYRFILDGVDTGYGASPSVTQQLSTEGRHELRVYVRDDTGNVVVKSYTLTVGTVPTGPKAVQSGTLALDATARLAWTVNPDNNTVTSVNIDTQAKVSEITVGARPSSLTVDGSGRVWVTCRDSDQIDIVDNGAVSTIQLDYGSRPYGIVYVPATDKVYVTTEGSGRLLEFDASNDTLAGSLPLGANARAITVTGDGARALVTKFITEGETASVWDVNLTTLAVTRVIDLVKDSTEDNDTEGRGVFNYLAAVSLTPDQSQAWVAASKVNVDRGEFLEGGPGQPNSKDFQNTVRPANCVIDMGAGAEDVALRLDHDNQAFPAAIIFSPLGDFAFVALRGSNEIMIYDIFDGAMVKRKSIFTDLSPDGMVYDEASRSLVVKNFMSRSMQIYDLSNFLDFVTAEEFLGSVDTVANEMLPPEVLLGKQVFYDASDLRMSLDGYLSCASCHDDGGTDGRTFDFTERGEGLRNTITLRGRRGMGHGRVHWTGNFDEIQDFEHDIRGPQGGLGFMSDAEFNTGTRNTPLGSPKAGVSAELDALAAYVESLREEPKSPYRNADGTSTASALAGEVHFQQLGCIACHGGPDFTDSSLNLRHDIGTITAGSGTRLGQNLDGFDTPSLRGLWNTAPYLHDGSAVALLDVFNSTHAPSGTAHAKFRTLDTAGRQELLNYLLELDANDPVAPGAPVAFSGSSNANEDGSVEITLVATDGDGDPLSYSVVRQPANGTLVITGNTATYTPDAGFNGTDSFTFIANDGVNDSNVVPVYVTVIGTNDAPVASNRSTNVGENSSGNILLLATDMDGDALTYSVVAQPSNGSVSIVGNTATYTPNAGYTGSDSFTFKANDGTVDSNTATIDVSVVPFVSVTLFSEDFDSAAWATQMGGSLPTTGQKLRRYPILTDTNPYGGKTYEMDEGPNGLHGETMVGTDWQWVVGSSALNPGDSQFYLVKDAVNGGGLSGVTMNGTSYFGFHRSTGIMLNLTDLGLQSSDLLSISFDWVHGDSGLGQALHYAVLDGAVDPTWSGGVGLHGSFGANDLEGSYGSIAAIDGAARAGTVTLAGLDVSAATGDVHLVFMNQGNVRAPVFDNVTILAERLSGVSAPIASNGSDSVAEDGSVDITLVATDADGDALIYSVVSTPANGSVSIAGNVATYTPDAEFNGSDSFSFRANDGTGNSNIATVDVTVNAVNDAPVTSHDFASVLEDGTVDITLSATDVEGDALTYSVDSPPAHGSASITGNTATYTPNAGFTGSDTFTFKASDGTDDSNTSTLFLTVTSGINHAPVASNGSSSVTEDGSVDITLVATDVELDPLTFSVVAQPANGLVSLSGSTATYTPNADYNGSDSFTFMANDGTNDSNTAAVDVTVHAVNDAPVASSGSGTTTEDTLLDITLSATDLDGDALSYSVVTQPVHGSVSIAGSTATYAPNAGFVGADSFTFQASDGAADSNAATIDISVTPAGEIFLETFDTPGWGSQVAAPNTGQKNRFTPTLTDHDANPATLHGETMVGTDWQWVVGDSVQASDNEAYLVRDAVNGGSLGTETMNGTAYFSFHRGTGIMLNLSDLGLQSDQALTISFDWVHGDDARNQSLHYAVLDGTVDPAWNGGSALYGEFANHDLGGSYGSIFAPDGAAASGTVTLADLDVSAATGDIYLVFMNQGNIRGPAFDNIRITTPVTGGTNHAPVASNGSGSVAEDGSVDITLVATDADDDALTYSVVNQPANGSVAISGSTATYTPNAGFTGIDAFTFKANDGTLDSNVATVDVAVLTPYQSWRDLHFTPVEIAAGEADRGHDSDGDRLSNEYEFLFGQDPRVAGPAAMSASLVEIGGSSWFELTYTRRSGADVSYTVWTSEDLTPGWTDVSSAMVETGFVDHGDGTATVTQRYPLDASTPQALFFRVGAGE